jgi:hypothetical protein
MDLKKNPLQRNSQLGFHSELVHAWIRLWIVVATKYDGAIWIFLFHTGYFLEANTDLEYQWKYKIT